MLYVSKQRYRTQIWSGRRTAHMFWALVPIAITLSPLLVLLLFATLAGPAATNAYPAGDPPTILIGP